MVLGGNLYRAELCSWDIVFKGTRRKCGLGYCVYVEGRMSRRVFRLAMSGWGNAVGDTSVWAVSVGTIL